MRSWFKGALTLWITGSVIAGPAGAGFDEAFQKKPDAWTWGQILEWAIDREGFARSFALVIGVSDYQHFEDLETTSGNPLRVKDHLIEEAGFDYVHVLTEENVTWSRVQALIMSTFRNMMTPDDRFLLYWSGHGTQVLDHEGEAQGFLPLSGSEPDDLSNMIEMQGLLRLDRYLKVKQSLYILDTCFSGLAFPESQASPPDHTIERLAKPGRHLLTAATDDQQTIASRTWSGSLFTDSFLKGISGAADAESDFSRDGVVSLLELTEYVRARVDAERRRKDWRGEITPKLHDLRDNEGEFFFLAPDKKIAKRQSEGGRYQGRFEDGMPVVVMGNDAATAAVACDRESDWRYYETIRSETAPGFFEAYLKKVENGELCGQYVEIARLKLQPAPAQLAPPAAEASLNLRPEDRTLVQQALSALGFDSGVPDGVFGALSRRAIAGWQRTQDEEPTGYLTALQYPRVLVAALDQDPAEQGDLRVAQRELSERRANLDTDVRALESQRKRLAEDQATQTRDVDAEAELREQHAALDEREAELARRSEELNRRIAEIESRASEIEHEQNQLTQPTPETQGSDRPLQEEDVINFGRYYALVIGNADYQYSQDLRSPEADAMAISALLTEKYDFTVIPLINASRNEILEALHRLKETLNEGDNLLIYYAGHSVRDESNGRGYWLPVDAESYPETAKWISTDDITDILDSMHARHVMVMADSYYSGSLTSNYDSPLGLGVPQEERPYWLQTIANKPARMALTSGNLSPVLDGGGGQHSIFAKALLEVLGTNDRVMEGWRVYLRVSARVSDVAQVYGLTQVPTYGPIESGKYAGGDFLFVRS